MDALISRRTFGRAVVGAGLVTAGVSLSTATASAASSDWMGGLPDSTLLSRISMPGTHGSATRVGGPAVANQDLTVAEQLQVGVRFLDARCRLISGSFAMHHGAYYQNLMFGDVVNQCAAFLSSHPSETILMRVKQEYSSDSDAAFGAVFADYQRRWPTLMKTDAHIPTLGQSRGRVVVISDNGGVPGIGWGGLDIADDYDIPTIFDLYSRKWPGVRRHLDAARTANSSNLFITFTSSWGWALWPRDAANAIAPKVSGYLGALNRQLVGVVPMDFMTAAKASQIYRLNF
ncbi:phosphatidylinositol-specific phospholipase C [Actinokineospora xionganensis]|uniref:1-phosphatidylinositol phosphodiesterase n=1 Tax=Actinokineospora xionganensis TaxID=2684470 RepID=A0ABR7L573_9PSEU|nr:phosphatidylinositol-specific phospholipase C [Actinokineospora xionganensis]MBC6447836.1 phosphatidylinositol-specific phospholipase C [Actinokineospora xionganensis]